MTTQRFNAPGEPDLDAFYGDIAEDDLQPLWRQQGLTAPSTAFPAPRKPTAPGQD